MVQSFILEIPELGYLLKQESIMEWQIYGPAETGSYEKICWHIASSGNKVTLRSDETPEGTRKSAEVDFAASRIVIRKGELSDGEFTKFLQFLLEKMVLSTAAGEMNF
ncbi:MAG TPA: hypothetical protein VLQ20_12205, partial [Planococcus sp. (in: firmicutes)]|nr:hypothetical protein [Planococcus sp. (in: firmicutes)]